MCPGSNDDCKMAKEDIVFTGLDYRLVLVFVLNHNPVVVRL